MLRLLWMELEGFRNFVVPQRVEFNDGHNLILGKNGSGKTTLLEVISAAVRGDFQAFAEESFIVRFAIRASQELIIEHTLSNKRIASSSSLAIEALLAPALVRSVAPTHQAHLELVFRGAAGVAKISVDHTNQLTLSAGGEEHSQSLRGIPLLALHPNLARVLAVLLPVAPAVKEYFWLSTPPLGRLDESLALLDRSFGASEESSALFGFSSAVDTETLAFPVSSVPPLWTVDIVRKISEKIAEKPEEIRLSSKDLPVIQAIARALEVEDAVLSLQRMSRTVNQKEERVQYGATRWRFRYANGREVPITALSYGERRWIAIQLHLSACPDIFIADELVNGLHHAWIEECVSSLEGRQTFLSSQNPLLLDYLAPLNREQAAKQFLFCLKSSPTERTIRAMSTEELDEFWSAFSIGIQHVSEVLRTRGLW